MYRKAHRLCMTLFWVVAVCTQGISAQVTTATMLGSIKDETNAVLPGVSVKVRHLDTGAVRDIVTDDEGRYRAPNLALGKYEVEAELTGFQTAVRSAITLTVGQEAVVDLVLKVGEMNERVVVSGEAALVETTSSTVRALVDDKSIRDLPLNGRDFSQLATLQAGVYAPPSMGRGLRAVPGAGPMISISGARPNQNNFLIDGSDVRDTHGKTAGVSGTMLGVDTVREFAVLTSIASAEYGKVAGGVINAVTKSGTNELHGSLFEFHRNDNLDARNWFDVRKPEFKRNQFGLTAGGPIRKDHTFFFGSYEGLRDRLSLTERGIVLTPDARLGKFPNRTVTINPRVKPYLELHPLPTPGGRDFGDGRAEFVWSISQPTDEDYFLVKVDQIISASDSVSVRYSFDDSSLLQQGASPGFPVLSDTRRQYTTIEERKVISPTVFNEFRVSFNRNVFGLTPEQTITLDPSLSFLPGRPMGEISVSGLATYGYNARAHRTMTQNLFGYADNLTITRGRHSMRFGVQIERYQRNSLSAYSQNARWVFTSVDSFLQGKPYQLDIMLPESDIIRGMRQVYLGAYIQDDFRITPRLTLNLGLREEFATEPVEVNGKLGTLVNPLTDKEVIVPKTLYENPCRICLAPRVGFAWDVLGDGRTALRGGFGVFYNIILPPDFLGSVMQMLPFFKRPLLFNPPFPSVQEAIASITAPPYSLDFIDVSPDQPYTLKYNLNIQRELLPDLVLNVGYTGSAAVHVGRQQNLNINQFQVLPDGRKFFPAGAQRFNPTFSAMAYKVFDSRANYNALQISVNRRFSQGLQLQVAYTFSKSMDETSSLGGSGESPGSTVHTMDPYDRSRDYGLSGFHVKKVLTSSFSYDIPMPATGVLERLLGGWQVNGILTLADGNAVNISNTVDRARAGNSTVTGGLHDRPDLKEGGSSNPITDSRNVNNYWDGSNFRLQEAGFFGNLGRDTGIIPGVATFDFALTKKIALDEQRTLQFRSEFFNIFNRGNFGNPNASVFINATGIPSASFGRITSTTTTNRQIQFALKFLF